MSFATQNPTGVVAEQRSVRTNAAVPMLTVGFVEPEQCVEKTGSSAHPRADRDWLNKIQRRERFVDFAWTLARVDWDFFTTHTFINPLPRQQTRVGMFWRWASDISKVCKVPLKNLLIALRCEQGEIGERPHLHALIGAVPSCNKMALRSEMFRRWKIIANNGDADFRLYNRSLAGADYVCKCLGAKAYEINKFSIAEETTLSQSVFSLIRTLDATNERRVGKLKRKDNLVTKLAGLKTPEQHGVGAFACPPSVPAGLPAASNLCHKTGSPDAGTS